MSHLKKQKKTKSGNGGKGKNVLAVIAAVLILGIAVRSGLGIWNSPGRGACNEIIWEFQTACNDLDAKRIVGCLKPSIANPLKAAILVGETVTSTNSQEALSAILSALGGQMSFLDSDQEIVTAFETMRLEPEKYGLPGKTRKVTCKGIFTVAGVEFEQYVNLYISKSKKDAYIAKMEFEKN